MNLDNFITEVYTLIDDEYKNLTKFVNLRKRGFKPKLSDSEVITMELIGEYLGFYKDLSIWKYFKNNKLYLFPRLGSRSNFVKQSSNLSSFKEILQKKIIEKYFEDIRLHIIDGFPMPICRYIRSKRCKSFKGEAGYGYCPAKDEKYYGFKGHIIVNENGIVEKVGVAIPSVDEREMMMEIIGNTKGLLIGDKGYICEEKKNILKEYGVDLETPVRINMKENRDLTFVKSIRKKRKIIETVISQLARMFNIENIRVRDLWHFKNRVIRKIIAHNVCTVINLIHNRNILNIESILN